MSLTWLTWSWRYGSLGRSHTRRRENKADCRDYATACQGSLKPAHLNAPTPDDPPTPCKTAANTSTTRRLANRYRHSRCRCGLVPPGQHCARERHTQSLGRFTLHQFQGRSDEQVMGQPRFSGSRGRDILAGAAAFSPS